MDIIVEIIVEIIFEVYAELMFYIVPKEKATSKKYKIFSALIASVVFIGVFALFIWGGLLLFDNGNIIGIIPILVAVVISIVQIVAGLILHNRKKKTVKKI